MAEHSLLQPLPPRSVPGAAHAKSESQATSPPGQPRNQSDHPEHLNRASARPDLRSIELVAAVSSVECRCWDVYCRAIAVILSAIAPRDYLLVAPPNRTLVARPVELGPRFLLSTPADFRVVALRPLGVSGVERVGDVGRMTPSC